MNLRDLCNLMSLVQSALNEFTDNNDTRHRILKVLQVAQDNGVILSPDAIAVELADLEPAEEETETET